MPIKIQCACGKALSVRDDLAGKAVKCPACQNVLRIPGAGASSGTGGAASPAKGATAKPAGPAAGRSPAKSVPARPAPAKPSPSGGGHVMTPAAAGGLDDLFRDEGFELKSGKTCPSCFQSSPKDAMLCIHCGFHFETGAKLAAHKSELDEEMSGMAALKKAERDMAAAKVMQDKMTSEAGMPWWLMALLLFLLVATTAVGVYAVNVARRVDDENPVEFNALATLMLLFGAAFNLVAIGGNIKVLIIAFRESLNQGLLSLFIPFYILYFAFSRYDKAGKTMIVVLLSSAIAGALFAGAQMQNQ